MTDRHRGFGFVPIVPLAFVLLLRMGLALADVPPTDPAAAPTLTDDELRTAYAEVQMIGGMVYTYYLTGSPDEAKLDAVVKRLGPTPAEAFLEKLGLRKVTAYAFGTAPLLRDIVRTTPVGRLSRTFRYHEGWAVMYVAAAKYLPVPPLEQLKDSLPKLVQLGDIPAPADALRPPLKYVFGAAQVRSVEALARLPPDTDVNMLLPSGSTMLSNAVAGSLGDLVVALLDRHADPNKCSAGTCPLTMAVYAKEAPAMLGLLLDHGADPNVVDPDAGALAPPLSMAILQPRGIELGELLISKGANVDGLPGAMPPLVGAAEKGDRAAIEMLLKHGADLYRPATVSVPERNALTVARDARADDRFQEWLLGEWRDVARHSPRFRWQASIVQDGRESPLGDRPIVLARKPFSIVVHMRPEAQLMLVASTERSVFEDYRDATRRGNAPMHSIAAVVADVCSGEQRPLFLSGNSNNPKLVGNRVMSWSDSERCDAFTAKTPEADGVRYVRTVGTLSTYDGDQNVASSTVASLFIVMGTALYTRFPDFEYVEPKQFEIRFR
jgi:hypothetical protein